MRRLRPVLAAVLAAATPLVPAFGQGEGAARWQMEPSRTQAPAWQLALWGESPYAECQAAGLPLPPSPAEVAALPATTRLQHMVALKAVWLERLIRAREERHRVTRENLAQAAGQARKLGAPAGFVELLQRQAAGGLPARERYLLEAAQNEYLAAYGVDAREMRFFVEGRALSPEQLREVVAWLPLPAVFNLPATGQGRLSARGLASGVEDFVSLLRECAAALQGVEDRESADAAAQKILALLPRYDIALRFVLHPLQELRDEALLKELEPMILQFQEDNGLYSRERTRLLEHEFYGSHRLQALDYLLH